MNPQAKSPIKGRVNLKDQKSNGSDKNDTYQSIYINHIVGSRYMVFRKFF